MATNIFKLEWLLNYLKAPVKINNYKNYQTIPFSNITIAKKGRENSETVVYLEPRGFAFFISLLIPFIELDYKRYKLEDNSKRAINLFNYIVYRPYIYIAHKSMTWHYNNYRFTFTDRNNNGERKNIEYDIEITTKITDPEKFFDYTTNNSLDGLLYPHKEINNQKDFTSHIINDVLYDYLTFVFNLYYNTNNANIAGKDILGNEFIEDTILLIMNQEIENFHNNKNYNPYSVQYFNQLIEDIRSLKDKCGWYISKCTADSKQA